MTGAIVVVGATVVHVTQRLSYWLPSAWERPVLVAAAVAGIVGVLAMVGLFNGITFGGVSAASGLLAMLAYVLTTVNLSELSSYDADTLSVAAAALGSVALTTGLSAIEPSRRAWRATAPVPAAVLGALLTWRVSMSHFPHYAPDVTRARHVGVTVTGILLILGAAFQAGRWLLTGAAPRSRRERLQRRSPAPVSMATTRSETVAPEHDRPRERATTEAVDAPDVSMPVRASGVQGAAPRRGGSRVQTAATVIGIASGVVSLGREIVSAVQALLG